MQAQVSRRQLNVGDYAVAIVHGVTKDGQAFVKLEGATCNLEGVEPGLYFLTPLPEKQRVTGGTVG